MSNWIAGQWVNICLQVHGCTSIGHPWRYSTKGGTGLSCLWSDPLLKQLPQSNDTTDATAASVAKVETNIEFSRAVVMPSIKNIIVKGN